MLNMSVKRVLFAVAGAGKTTHLVNELTLTDRVLLLTYTENNARNLEAAIVKKFKKLPDNIVVSTYFSFLLNFLIKPFCLKSRRRISRLYYAKGEIPRYLKGEDRYITGGGEEVYHSRAFPFASEYIGLDKLRNRIELFFDKVFVDEVQDFAGYDFDFIEMIGTANIDVLLAGDFFQHTFDTSRDGGKNKCLHDDYSSYKKRFSRYYIVDEQTLSCSYRCPKTICSFVSNKIGIPISASGKMDSPPPVLIEDSSRIEAILQDEQIIKLFYRKSYEYRCNAFNWGACKGLTFDKVCVVLNPSTFAKFAKDDLRSLAVSTRNKLYVACTRTSSLLYFVREKDVESFKRNGETSNQSARGGDR